MQTVQQLARQGYDVFINLCDGAWDEDLAGLKVAPRSPHASPASAPGALDALFLRYLQAGEGHACERRQTRAGEPHREATAGAHGARSRQGPGGADGVDPGGY